MDTIYVQFSDNTEQRIVSAFTSPQDPMVWPNQGTVTSSDPRWAAYFATLPAGIAAAWPAPVES